MSMFDVNEFRYGKKRSLMRNFGPSQSARSTAIGIKIRYTFDATRLKPLTNVGNNLGGLSDKEFISVFIQMIILPYRNILSDESRRISDLIRYKVKYKSERTQA